MKNFIILIIAIVSLSANSSTEPERDLARVYSKQGKYIFPHCVPATEYEVLFTVKMPGMIWSDSQINSFDKIENFVQKRANKQAMKMGLVYDALIVNGWDNSYAIRFK